MKPIVEEAFTPTNQIETEERVLKFNIEGEETILKWRVVIEEGDNKLFRFSIDAENDDGYVFIINRAHPFMKSFVNLPGADLDPIFRMSLALALAELLGKSAGLDQPGYIRNKMNAILLDALSQKVE